MDNINWYPGHMKKTRELIEDSLKMVDLVIEVVDARIPVSSRNPIIDQLTRGKRRVIILNKSDLSDPSANEAWENRLKEEGNMVTAMNCMKGQGTKQLLKLLSSLQAEKNEGKIRKKPLRMMIVGVPNVGKSSLIKVLQDKYPKLLIDRYKIEDIGDTPLETMEAIAKRRGFILAGKRIDYERCARTLLDEFRGGVIGNITLETADD